MLKVLMEFRKGILFVRLYGVLNKDTLETLGDILIRKQEMITLSATSDLAGLESEFAKALVSERQEEKPMQKVILK